MAKKALTVRRRGTWQTGAVLTHLNLVLARGANDTAGVSDLADFIARQNIALPGIFGPTSAAQTFMYRWVGHTRQAEHSIKDMTIYSLGVLTVPKVPDGHFRMANDGDAKTLAAWYQSFADEALPPAEKKTTEESLNIVKENITKGSIAVWDNGHGPVSAAQAKGPWHKMMRIGFVYTPSEERGKGYAAATVAHLSHDLQDRGIEVCLYADDDNAASTHIYKKLGFTACAKARHYSLQT
ncbi:MAG: GNAT family N-acetyltransferase [Alphaproteobacteria bacterium]|nr:GNAT family N-acetyltransferase [Alphaproteobacteria bacterium]